MGVGAVAVALVIVMALGVAGTVAFVRYQAQKEAADAGAFVPPPPLSASEAPVAAAPVASETAAPVASEAVPPIASASASASASAPAPASASASAPPPPPIASASAAPATSAAPSAPVAEGMGVITTATAAKNRRIFVDDKVVGQTPSSVTVQCGAHKVKLGSSGLVQDIDVPCGSEIAVADKDR
jgi:hypothetical protein